MRAHIFKNADDTLSRCAQSIGCLKSEHQCHVVIYIHKLIWCLSDTTTTDVFKLWAKTYQLDCINHVRPTDPEGDLMQKHNPFCQRMHLFFTSIISASDIS